jgi:hypothetical protein
VFPLDKDLHGRRQSLPWNYFRFARYPTTVKGRFIGSIGKSYVAEYPSEKRQLAPLFVP